MNRYLFVTLCLFFFSCFMYAQMPEYTLAQFGLKGKVYSVTERTGECAYSSDQYTFAQEQQKIETFFFNTNGTLSKRKRYTLSGQEEVAWRNSYNAKSITITTYGGGKEIASCQENWDLSPSSSSKVQYSFYDNGSVKTIRYFDDDGELFNSFTYNLRGQLIEKKKYKVGVPKTVFTYSYGKDNNMVSVTRTGVGGVLIGKVIYKYFKYDSYGNWTMRVAFTQENDNGKQIPYELTTRLVDYY